MITRWAAVMTFARTRIAGIVRYPLLRRGPPPEGKARFLMSGSDQDRGDLSDRRSIAVSEPRCRSSADL